MRHVVLITVLCCKIICGFIIPPKFAKLLDTSILSENGRSGAKKKILVENSTDYKYNEYSGLKKTNRSGTTLEKIQNKLPLQEHSSVKESNVDERSFVFIDSKFKVPMLNHFHNLQQKVHKDYFLKNANYKTFVSNVGSVNEEKFAEVPEPIKGFVENNSTRIRSSGKIHWKHRSPKYYDKAKKNPLLTEVQNMKNKIQTANSVISRQYDLQGKQTKTDDIPKLRAPVHYSRPKINYPYRKEKPTPTTNLPIRLWKVKTPNEKNGLNTQQYLLEVKKPIPNERQENTYNLQSPVSNGIPIQPYIPVDHLDTNIDRKVTSKNEDISTIVFTDEQRDHLELLKPPLLRQDSEKNMDNQLHMNDADNNNYKYVNTKRPNNYFLSAFGVRPTDYVLKDVISKNEESGLEDHFRSDDTYNHGEDKILDRFIKNTPDGLGEDEKIKHTIHVICGGKTPSNLCRCGVLHGKERIIEKEMLRVSPTTEETTDDEFENMYNKI